MILRLRREPPPPTWGILAKHLQLSPALARKWWYALRHSDALCCISITSGVLLGDSGATLGQAMVLEPLVLLDKHLSPQRTIPCLENLYIAGALVRAEANLIQERVLFKTTAAGQWRLSHREPTHAY